MFSLIYIIHIYSNAAVSELIFLKKYGTRTFTNRLEKSTCSRPIFGNPHQRRCVPQSQSESSGSGNFNKTTRSMEFLLLCSLRGRSSPSGIFSWVSWWRNWPWIWFHQNKQHSQQMNGFCFDFDCLIVVWMGLCVLWLRLPCCQTRE